MEAFTQKLDPSIWRWYSHDPSTLRAVDPEYRNFEDLKPGFDHAARGHTTL